MTRISSGIAIVTASLMIIAGCGTEEQETPARLTAEITCSDRDSILATVYMMDGGSGTSAWCACGAGACTVEFGGLGYGEYVLGLSVPDSVYARTEGAEGRARTLGYYAQGGLAEVADTISLSAEQPTANVVLDVEAGPSQRPAATDTLGRQGAL